MKSRKSESRFPASIFVVYLIVLLAMSGVHTGLLVLMGNLGWSDTVQIAVPLLYWGLIAVGLTLFTRWRIRRTYDIPVQKLAQAARQVAEGDFSVYVPTMHTAENKDYLDRMIEDFNKMVAELGSIETLKTDFFANVSHEFKTPLSGIQNYAMLLQQKNLSESERREYAAAIAQSTRRLSDLISNMLKLNKLEKQTIVPAAVPYDLCEQLCGCVAQFDDRMEQKDIEFEADLEDRAILAADESLLELVWNNLLSNAVKFTLYHLRKGQQVGIKGKAQGAKKLRSLVLAANSLSCFRGVLFQNINKPSLSIFEVTACLYSRRRQMSICPAVGDKRTR